MCTGGEPLLQLDEAAVDALHAAGLRGRDRDQRHPRAPAGHRLDLRQPEGRRTDSSLTAGDELKLVFPQAGADPSRSSDLDFEHFCCSRWTGPTARRNTAARRRLLPGAPAVALSLQTHKYLGIA